MRLELAGPQQSAVRSMVLAIGLIVGAGAQAKTITFDPAGSINTVATGMNATGWVAGDYEDTSGVQHGFLRAHDGSITTFDAESAPCGTYPMGINKKKLIVGYYQDASCEPHGFCARG